MLPDTYLLTAPDADDPIGKGMLSADLIAGLRRCNSTITVPMPEHYESMGWQYPGIKNAHTCIWLGQPPSENMAGRKKYAGGIKITSLILGFVPEFTQMDPEGEIISRGWRDILRRTISCGAASKRRVEREFGVSLDYVGIGAGCLMCARRGLRSRANPKTKLCDECEKIRMTPEAKRKVLAYMRKQFKFNGESQVGASPRPSREIKICQS